MAHSPQTALFLLPDPREGKWEEHGETESQECNVLALILAKDAMENRFPLNGTFFQTNELFLIDGPPFSVPGCRLSVSDPGAPTIVRVYFGTSVSRITLGMGTAEVTHLFNNSYVCVRNFDAETKQSTKLHAFLSP